MRHTLVAMLLVPALLLPLAAQAKPKAKPKPRPAARQEGPRLPEFLQPPVVKQNVLLDLSESGYGGLGVLYDRAVGMQNSINGGVALAGSGGPNNYWTSVELKAGYSWWIHKDFWAHVDRPLLGWFAGPVLKVDLVNWHLAWGGGSYNSSGAYFGGAAQGGYQWLFKPGLTARLYAEAGYMAGSMDNLYSQSIGYGGPFVGAHLAAGWSF